jgi:hypothetical protein
MSRFIAAWGVNIRKHRSASLQQPLVVAPFIFRRRRIPAMVGHGPPDALDSFRRLWPWKLAGFET